MDKVLIVVPRLIGHGMERMAVLASESIRDKYDTEIVVFTGENQEYKTDTTIINLNIPAENGVLRKAVNVVKRVFRLKKHRKSCGASAVISFGTSANIANVLSKGKGRTIISFRGYATVSKSVSFFLTCLLADWIFCISEGLLIHLHELCPWAVNKSSVIYNRIDLKGIREKSLEKVDFEPSHPAFVAMGRLEPVKGHKHLLRAFAAVKKEIPHASLTLIGEGKDCAALKYMAKELHIEDSVLFIGKKENPFPYMKKCDICVATSITEGFMNVLVEAGVCGLAAVSTDCKAGPREILSQRKIYAELQDIEYAEYGVLVPPFSSNDSDESDKDNLLANAMTKLAVDKKIYERYSLALSKRAEDFSIEKYHDDIIALLKGGKMNENK